MKREVWEGVGNWSTDYAFYIKDERQKLRYIVETCNLTEDRVKNGKQIEWQLNTLM